jgi:Leucine-rich repeat (LRR) protein
MGKLSKLKSLNLSHNKITSLPASLGDLGELQSLDLWGNKDLSSVPEGLGKLKKLESFKLNTAGWSALDLGKLRNGLSGTLVKPF